MTSWRVRSGLAGALVGVLLVACVRDRMPIPSGVYRNLERTESIVVTEEGLAFHLSGVPAREGGPMAYSVFESGQIHPKGLRSAEYVQGIGSYEWIWNGTGILKRNPRTNVTELFSLEGAPKP